MMKTILILLVLALIAFGGFLLFSRDAESPTEGVIEDGAMLGEQDETAAVTPPVTTDSDGTMEEKTNASEQTTIVTYTNAGYSPSRIEITAGEGVTFVNGSSVEIWPASDIHPTHTLYPESDIKKCFDGSATSHLFDACHALASGEEWSFIFSEVGEWTYHDHRHPTHSGMIVVK